MYVKYPMYIITKRAPPVRVILFENNAKTAISAPDASITSKSAREECVSAIGLIADERPVMNAMLNILEPTILPMAMSFSFFIAATTLVTSSGKDVPAATIVSPTRDSLIPKSLAILDALSTTSLPPKIIPASPRAANRTLFISVPFLTAFEFCCGLPLFFARKISHTA